MTEKQALKRLGRILGPKAAIKIVDHGEFRPTKSDRDQARDFVRQFRADGEPPERRVEAKRQAQIMNAQPRFAVGQNVNVLNFGLRFQVAAVGDTLRQAVLNAESQYTAQRTVR